MISKEILQQHYKEYASQPDSWVSNMEKTKFSIVDQVISSVGIHLTGHLIKVAVLGASDSRYVAIHQRIFEKILKSKTDLTTLDFDIEHLSGASGVVNHDVTITFPSSYDIVFSHELMKFLTPIEQLRVIENSYKALDKNGLAMHIVHEPSIKSTQELRTWQYRVDPNELINQLQKNNLPARKLVFQSNSQVDWLKETTVIILQK